MACKTTEEVINLSQQVGLPRFQNKWRVYYGHPKRPNYLLYFSNDPIFSGNPEGLADKMMTEYVFDRVARAGEGVLDPCIGKGLTAKMAHKFGMVCYGVELNAKRLKVTIEWLINHGYPLEGNLSTL